MRFQFGKFYRLMVCFVKNSGIYLKVLIGTSGEFKTINYLDELVFPFGI